MYSGVLEIFFGSYPNLTYGIYPPTGLWKFVDMVPVGYSDFLSSIDCFDWSKMSFNLFVQSLFCLLLTCVYHIYWVIIHWSWNLLSIMLEKNSVGHIQSRHIYSLPPQVCGRLWRGWRFMWFHLLSSIHWLDPSKSSQVLQVFSCVYKWGTKGNKDQLCQYLAINLWVI